MLFFVWCDDKERQLWLTVEYTFQVEKQHDMSDQLHWCFLYHRRARRVIREGQQTDRHRGGEKKHITRGILLPEGEPPWRSAQCQLADPHLKFYKWLGEVLWRSWDIKHCNLTWEPKLTGKLTAWSQVWSLSSYDLWVPHVGDKSA